MIFGRVNKFETRVKVEDSFRRKKKFWAQLELDLNWGFY